MRLSPRLTHEIKPGIVDEQRGSAALLINNSGFYFIFNPKRARGRVPAATLPGICLLE